MSPHSARPSPQPPPPEDEDVEPEVFCSGPPLVPPGPDGLHASRGRVANKRTDRRMGQAPRGGVSSLSSVGGIWVGERKTPGWRAAGSHHGRAHRRRPLWSYSHPQSTRVVHGSPWDVSAAQVSPGCQATT